MPRYHFRCARCVSEFSESLPLGTSDVPACPVCKKADKVTKLMKAPMVHFKGTGFYKTDGSKPIAAPKKEAEKAPETPVKVEPVSTPIVDAPKKAESTS